MCVGAGTLVDDGSGKVSSINKIITAHNTTCNYWLKIRINGSLLPISLLNMTIKEQFSCLGTNTDLAIYIGLLAFSTWYILLNTTPVSLHCIIIIASLGASPVHCSTT